MKFPHRLLAVASAAFFIATSALAQNAGTVTNHAFALGKGAGQTGYTSLLCGSAQLAVGQAAADPICKTITGDVTITAAGVTAIGATKVTNAMLAAMAANTTKCNATAGSAVPTDCTASTMRTNIGVVIGTNVQAWDTDLDCLAAISTTGTIKRTGSGTCSAGTVALSDLATGTQDTVIGYFGSTTSSAIAINNCSGALTYSTATHTFGCNASAGTGTVTSVASGTGLTGGPITSSGTLAVSLTTASNVLGADVALNNTGLYFDGPSMAQGTSGTWFASGTVTVLDTANVTAGINCKLWDGTTVYASTRQITPGVAGIPATITLSGIATSPAANIRISCQDISGTTGVIKFNSSGNSKDSSIYGFRIQ